MSLPDPLHFGLAIGATTTAALHLGIHCSRRLWRDRQARRADARAAEANARTGHDDLATCHAILRATRSRHHDTEWGNQ